MKVCIGPTIQNQKAMTNNKDQKKVSLRAKCHDLLLNYHTVKSRINNLGWTTSQALAGTSPKIRGEKNRTHGMSGTRPYRVWKAMRTRCYNKNSNDYVHYGARGIKIEWPNFHSFWADMKSTYQPHLEIDRIDNNGNYCKENCRWATRSQQVNNTRRCTRLTYNGQTKNITQWANHLGVKRTLIKDRIYRLRWPVHKALTLPALKNN